jgi:hypothetical protein
MDGTFNQTRPLDLLVGKEVLFSYDLSDHSSTDRRPLEIMEGITTLLKVVLIGFGLRVLINDLN